MKKFDQFINESSNLSPEDSLKIIAAMMVDQLEVTDKSVIDGNAIKQLDNLHIKIDVRPGEGCSFELYLSELFPYRDENMYEIVPLMEQQLRSIKKLESLRNTLKADFGFHDNETKRVTLLSFWVEYEDLMSTEIQSFIKSSSQIKKFNL